MRWLREFVRILRSAMAPKAGADDGGHAERSSRLDETTRPFGG